MRLLLTILLIGGILLLGCQSSDTRVISSEPQIRCEAPNVMVGNSCCLDENANGVCDNREPVETIETEDVAVEETGDELDEALEADPVEEVPVGPSLTEQYKETFLSKAKYYSYSVIDETYDDIWIWTDKTIVKVIPQEYYFEVKGEKITKSKWYTTKMDDTFFGNLEDMVLDVIDYVWVDKDGDTGGCFVHGGNNYYLKENCLWNNRSLDSGERHKIIFEDLHFEKRPQYALDWYDTYAGKEPSKIQEGYKYVDQLTDREYRVDYVYFDNGDGTETRIFVNTINKFPLKVEKLRDKKVIWDIEYSYLTVNAPSTLSFHTVFMEI